MSKNTFLLLSLFLFFRPLFACTKDNFVSEKGIVVEDVDVYPNDGEEAGLKEIKEIKGWFDFLCSPELGGRYSGSGGIEHAVGYIASIIGESDSLTVYSFDTDKCPMKNIVFHIEGDCDSLLVFGAHYDAYGYYTHTPLPGADDNMSGTAVLLSLIKAIQRAQIHPKYSVDICFFDGEEIGRYGSRYYLNQCKRGIKQYINIDTCGNKDYGIVVLYDIKHPFLQREFESFVHIVSEIGSKVAVYNPKGYTTDCEYFESKNIPFVSIQNDKHSYHLHTIDDNVSHISFKKIDDLAKGLDQYIRTSYSVN